MARARLSGRRSRMGREGRQRMAMHYFRYSRWDGSQQIAPFDPDEVIEHLADDLLADGDLRSALQRMMQSGYKNPDGQRLMGLQQLLERLRQQRQQQLDQFQLNDIMKDIREKLEEVLSTEREGIERRLERAREGKPASDERGDSPPQARSGEQGAP